MNLTKTEMEDIWNTKPVGYLADLRKRNKNTKLYKVKLQPYTRILYDIHEVTIRARDRDNASLLARSEVLKQYTDKQIDGWIIKGIDVL